MGMLSKETTLFLRNKEGELLPLEITLSIKGSPTVRIIPLTRGEFAELNNKSKEGKNTQSDDDEIIIKHCVEPKYTSEEIRLLRPVVANAIVTAIINTSLGYGDNINDASEEEEELKKN